MIKGGFVMNQQKLIIGFIASILFLIFFGTVVYFLGSTIHDVKKDTSTPHVSTINDFGNGVRYFPFTGEEFGKKLSEFLGSNTNLEISAISGEVRKHGIVQSFWSSTDGYFVTFREKK